MPVRIDTSFFKCGVFTTAFLLLFGSCKDHSCNSFTTVDDLDRIDFKKCKVDSMFIYMQRFSGGLDSFRRVNNIPSLPKNFSGILYTVDNQVSWLNAAARDSARTDSAFRRAHLLRKDLEWKENTLRYDRSVFRLMDPNETYVTITYYLDSMAGNGNYKFEYELKNRQMELDHTLKLTRAQADSLLQSLSIRY